MNFNEMLANSVNKLTPDLDDLYDGACRYSMSDWELQQRSLATASGAGAVAIPGLHLAGLAADFAFIINRAGVASYGIGAIKGAERHGNVLEQEDFVGVLNYWAGDADFMEAMKGKGAADLSSKVGIKVVTKVGGKVAVKGLTKAMLTSAGYMVAQKFGAKAMAKPAAKIAAKFGGKALGGFIPILGPIVGGGVNLWLISGIMDAASGFYRDKLVLVDRLV